PAPLTSLPDPLSLHDALPIYRSAPGRRRSLSAGGAGLGVSVVLDVSIRGRQPSGSFGRIGGRILACQWIASPQQRLAVQCHTAAALDLVGPVLRGSRCRGNGVLPHGLRGQEPQYGIPVRRSYRHRDASHVGKPSESATVALLERRNQTAQSRTQHPPAELQPPVLIALSC